MSDEDILYINLAVDKNDKPAYVVGGLFTMHDTMGISVDISYDILQSHGWYVDWCDFLADAGRQKDWKFDWAVEKMRMTINNDEVCDDIVKKFKMLGGLLLGESKKIAPDAHLDFNQICNAIISKKKSDAKNFKQFLHENTKKTDQVEPEGQGNADGASSQAQ